MDHAHGSGQRKIVGHGEEAIILIKMSDKISTSIALSHLAVDIPVSMHTY